MIQLSSAVHSNTQNSSIIHFSTVEHCTTQYSTIHCISVRCKRAQSMQCRIYTLQQTYLYHRLSTTVAITTPNHTTLHYTTPHHTMTYCTTYETTSHKPDNPILPLIHKCPLPFLVGCNSNCPSGLFTSAQIFANKKLFAIPAEQVRPPVTP